jgi:hypothetical protein
MPVVDGTVRLLMLPSGGRRERWRLGHDVPLVERDAAD